MWPIKGASYRAASKYTALKRPSTDPTATPVCKVVWFVVERLEEQPPNPLTPQTHLVWKNGDTPQLHLQRKAAVELHHLAERAGHLIGHKMSMCRGSFWGFDRV